MTAVVQEVHPASHRPETRGVLLATLVMLVAWGGLVAWRRTPPPADSLLPYQRSAFATLSALEQGLFNDLRTAVAEIEALQAEAGAWPAPEALAAHGLPPFVEDLVWQRRGRHQWRLLEAGRTGEALYWARPAAPGDAEWALLLTDGGATIWRRDFAAGGSPPRALPSVLVLEGWSEIVAREPAAP